MNMNEKELLASFLGGHPDSCHPLDRERFLLYALACAKNNHNIDCESIRNHGISEDKISEYQIAFEWIRDAYRILNG